jgi:hypothetical protein
MVDSNLGFYSKHSMFRLKDAPSAGPPSLAKLREITDVIKAFDKTISDCAKFQLPESPSLTDVLMKQHYEYCVLKAWVCSAIRSLLRWHHEKLTQQVAVKEKAISCEWPICIVASESVEYKELRRIRMKPLEEIRDELRRAGDSRSSGPPISSAPKVEVDHRLIFPVDTTAIREEHSSSSPLDRNKLLEELARRFPNVAPILSGLTDFLLERVCTRTSCKDMKYWDQVPVRFEQRVSFVYT